MKKVKGINQVMVTNILSVCAITAVTIVSVIHICVVAKTFTLHKV